MPTRTELEKSLERASSDYVSVSRSAGLFGDAEYERAEAEAWQRLEEAREALEAARSVGV